MLGHTDGRARLVQQPYHLLNPVVGPHGDRPRARQRLQHVACAKHAQRVHMGDEFGHIFVGGGREDLARGAALNNAPAFHDRDAAAQFEGLVQVMADKDDGAFQPRLQVQQFILQPGSDQWIQGRKGFIHQQDRRIGGKGAGQANALLHAA